MGTSKTASLVADVSAVLGEGPVWIEREQALYWVDIKGYKVFRHRPADGALKTWDTPYRVCSLAPRAQGGFIGGTEDGFSRVDLEADRFIPLVNPEPERMTNRFNDGKLDRAGRFWAGTMDGDEREATGALYRLNADNSWARVDDGYRVTNGPAFSPDGRLMYHNDSALQVTYLFDLDEAATRPGGATFPPFGRATATRTAWTVDGKAVCGSPSGWMDRSPHRLQRSKTASTASRCPSPSRPAVCSAAPDLAQLFHHVGQHRLSEERRGPQPHAGGCSLRNRACAALPTRRSGAAPPTPDEPFCVARDSDGGIAAGNKQQLQGGLSSLTSCSRPGSRTASRPSRRPRAGRPDGGVRALRRWREDFELVEETGIHFLRYGPPIYRPFLGPANMIGSSRTSPCAS
jgi:sugar lactone lactonase YvrE